MSFFTRYSYLTANARANLLKGYHYEGSDASLFSMLLQPFWEASARLIPTHTAPNLITALGFIGSVIAYFTMIYYNPTLNNGTTTPSWVYYLCAFLLFYYQTIDAVDGKHARNTKSSSAMGELFDHGLDALNCLLQVTIIVATLQLGPTMYSCICVFVMYITSYLVIWEDYVTDELRFGMLNSPTEALLAAAGLLVFTGLVGGRIWTETYIFGIALQQIIVGACLLMGISVVYDSLKIVLTKAKSQKIHRAVEIGGSQGAINALVPFFGTVLLFVIYSFVAPELYTLYPITFLSTYGLLGSYMQVCYCYYSFVIINSLSIIDTYDPCQSVP